MLTSKNSFVKIWRTQEVKFCALLRALAYCFVIVCKVAILSNKGTNKRSGYEPGRFFVRQVILWQRMYARAMAMLDAS